MTAAKQRVIDHEVTDLELKALEEWLLNVNSARPGPETRAAMLLVIDELRNWRERQAKIDDDKYYWDDVGDIGTEL